MNKYFRIKGYNPKDNYSFIIDSNGTFEKLWQFSAYLVQKGLKIIEVYSDDKVEIYYNFIEDNSSDGSSRQGCLLYSENKEYKTNDYNYKEQGFVLKFKVELYL